jgi:DNA-binding transcriptional MocR family regulator
MGWINASDSFLSQLEKVKQATDLHTPSLNQYMILEYIKAGKLEPHIQKICEDYRSKRDLMLLEMTKQFPKQVSWTIPQGGMFLWVELPKHISTKDLLPKAIEVDIVYVPGGPFFPNGGNEYCLRLNFSNASRENIVEGIKRLDKLLKSVIL